MAMRLGAPRLVTLRYERRLCGRIFSRGAPEAIRSTMRVSTATLILAFIYLLDAAAGVLFSSHLSLSLSGT